MQFVDGALSFGPRATPLPKPLENFESLAQVQSRMDAYGIDEAYVCYTPCIEGCTKEENLNLANLCREHGRIKPVFVALPHHGGDFDTPEVFIKAMKAQGVGLVKLLPLQQGFILSDFVCGELFDAFHHAKVPVLLAKDNALSWEELDRILTAYPHMPVILSETYYRVNRILYPLMEKHPNLYLETGSLKSHLAIEDFSARFGANRLIFGSGMPVNDGGAAVAKVTYAALSDKDKAAIAGENLKRLVGGIVW